MTGRFLATVCSNGTVTIYRLDPNHKSPVEVVEIKKKVAKPAWCVKWADPRFDLIFAVCYFDQQIVLYQLVEDKIVTLYEYNAKSSVNKCDFAPWGFGLKLTAVTSAGECIVIERTNEFKALPFKAHNEIASSVSWASAFTLDNFLDGQDKHSKARQIFATCGCDGAIKIWEIKKEITNPKEILSIKDSHKKVVRDISWSNNAFLDSCLLASGGEDGLVCIWKIVLEEEKATCEKIYTKDYKSPVWKTSFNFSGNLLAVAFSSQQGNQVEVLCQTENNTWEKMVDAKNESTNV